MEHISAEVLNAVKEAAEDGKLTCVKAHHIGEKLNISLAIIGEAANQ